MQSFIFNKYCTSETSQTVAKLNFMFVVRANLNDKTMHQINHHHSTMHNSRFVADGVFVEQDGQVVEAPQSRRSRQKSALALLKLGRRK